MLTRALIGLPLGALIALLAVRGRVLTLPAALLAAGMLIAILALGGYHAAGYIVVIFGLCAAVHAVAKRKKSRHAGGARGVRQVACNGLVGTLCLVGYALLPHPCWLVAYYASVTEFFSDTVASDLGTLCGGTVRDICRLCRVPRGRSGGVSAAGTLLALLAAAVGFLLSFFSELGPLGAAVAALAAFLGMLFDSVLGSLVQGKFRCRVCGAATERRRHCDTEAERLGGVAAVTNGTVNLLSGLFAAALAALLYLLL
ncbi:MAG: DUF92 domain-containing protein [Clostridia bacterium]|nr:DUF92 domain-containing protein [Clostridia bacterium]